MSPSSAGQLALLLSCVIAPAMTAAEEPLPLAALTQPRLIQPLQANAVESQIEGRVALVGYVDDSPRRQWSSFLPLQHLPPTDGIRRQGNEQRSTALWAEVEELDYFLPDQDWSPGVRRSTQAAAVSIATGAFLANTSADHQIHQWYQRDFRSETTDRYARTAKLFGEGTYIFPAVIAMLATTRFYDEGPIFEPLDEYSVRLTKAYLGGFPILLGAQFMTGASRPDENGNESKWKFLDDNNGVSGHAFVGAMPFIVAAQMTENRVAKGGLYAASALTAWSRVNDGAHYSSQVFLGWSLAYAVACAAGDQPFYSDRVAVLPVATPDMTGIAIMISR